MKKGIQQKIFPFSRSLALRHRVSLTLVAWALATQSLAVENGRPKIGEIESLFFEAEYKKANAKISTLLAEKSLVTSDRLKLYWLKAICEISEGNAHLAKLSFSQLLELDGDFEPAPNSSPKILKVFDEVKSYRKKMEPVSQLINLSYSPIGKIRAGDKHTFALKAEPKSNLNAIKRLRLYLRQLGNSDYSALDFVPVASHPDEFIAEIPSFLTARIETQVNFEYFVEATSDSSAVIGSIASKALPQTFEVVPINPFENTQNENTYESWGQTVIWVSAAALAAATIATFTYVFSTPDSGSLRLKIYNIE